MRLTKMDEETAISLTLVLWHGHDARDVVLLLTEFFLREVANEVTSLFVIDSEYVEEERLDVVVECFVVKKELG